MRTEEFKKIDRFKARQVLQVLRLGKTEEQKKNENKAAGNRKNKLRVAKSETEIDKMRFDLKEKMQIWRKKRNEEERDSDNKAVKGTFVKTETETKKYREESKHKMREWRARQTKEEK